MGNYEGGDPPFYKSHTITPMDSDLLYSNTIEKLDIHSYGDLLFYMWCTIPPRAFLFFSQDPTTE
jgi:hypothetical protein